MGGKKDTEPRPTIQREKLAGFMYDIAKLVFAGVVVGAITPIFKESYENVSILSITIGSAATTVFAFIANWLLKTK